MNSSHKKIWNNRAVCNVANSFLDVLEMALSRVLMLMMWLTLHVINKIYPLDGLDSLPNLNLRIEVLESGGTEMVCNSVAWICRAGWACVGAGVGLRVSFLAA
jgi:hypothetical protein